MWQNKGMNTTTKAGRAAQPIRFVLSAYVDKALSAATYDKLHDGTFGGRIPPCPGVVAFGSTLRECEHELRSTLEDWILVGHAAIDW